MKKRWRGQMFRVMAVLLCVAMFGVGFLNFGTVEAEAVTAEETSDAGIMTTNDSPESSLNTSTTPYILFSSTGEICLSTFNEGVYWDGELEYSYNGSAWYTFTGAKVTATWGTLYVRGTNNTYLTGGENITNVGNSGLYQRWQLTGTDIYCYGNIMSLLDYRTVARGIDPTMANAAFANLFYNNANLLSAPLMPAVTLSNYCYMSMYYGCIGLQVAPALPATTMADGCYFYMFYGCEALTEAPALPAVTLARACYYNMLYNCKGITRAPALPATVMQPYCYAGMFMGTGIRRAPELPATTLAEHCYYNMFNMCDKLVEATNLPAEVVPKWAYSRMFRECTSLRSLPNIAATRFEASSCDQMFSECSSLLITKTQSDTCWKAWSLASDAIADDSTWNTQSLEKINQNSGVNKLELNTTFYYNAPAEYNIWVGGVQLNEVNYTDVLCDDGSVVYDPDNNLLTLNNAVITGTYSYATIYTTESIDIRFAGINHLSGGIDVGNRALKMFCGSSIDKLTVDGIALGIRANSLTLTNMLGTIRVNGSDGAVNVGMSMMDDGVHTIGSVELDGTFEATEISSGYVTTKSGVIVKTAEFAPHATEIMLNETQHYMGCVCGYIVSDSIAEHTPTEDDNNCLTPVLCTICQYEIEAGGGHIAVDDGDCTTALVCTVCNMVVTEASEAHVYAPDSDGDCTTPDQCVNCEYVQNEAAHDFTGEYMSNEGGHWHMCTQCQVIDRILSHTPEADDYDCTTAHRCTTCGYVLEEARAHHDPRNEREDCTVAVLCLYCDQVHTPAETAHAPSEEDHNCATPTTCITCGYIIKAAAEHDFLSDPIYDTNLHWHKCKNCLVTDIKTPHTKGEDDGDCTTAVKCTECDYLYPKNTAHTPAPDDSDCTTAVTCIYCEYIAVPKEQAHDFSAPCLYDDDAHWHQCTRCDQIDNKVQHTEGADDGDCTTGITCIDCAFVMTAGEAAHDYPEDDNDCTTEMKCIRCDHVDAVAEAAHDFGDAYLSNGEIHWHQCTRCAQTDEKQAHTPAEDDHDCTTATLCTVCEHVLVEARAEHVLAADDHDCTTPTLCLYCDYVGVEAEDTHDFTGAYLYNTDGHWHQCTRCDKTDSSTIHIPEKDDGDCTTAVKCTICNYIIVTAKESHNPAADDGDCTTSVYCLTCGSVTTEAMPAHEVIDPDGDCTTLNSCANCSVEIINKAHEFTVNAQYNNQEHWHKCAHCTVIQYERVPHTRSVDDGNCTTPVLCTGCPFVFKPASSEHVLGAVGVDCTLSNHCENEGCNYFEKRDAHVFGDEYLSDAAGHWHKCERCSRTDASVEHTYGTDGKCTVCTYQKTTFTIRVENGSFTNKPGTMVEFSPNGIVTIRANDAPGGQKFKGWMINDEIVSTSMVYAFVANGDTVVCAVYEPINAGGSVTPPVIDGTTPPDDASPPATDAETPGDTPDDGADTDYVTIVLIIVGVAAGIAVPIVVVVVIVKKKNKNSGTW